MAKRTEFMGSDFLFVSPVLADGTQPKLIVHQRLPRDNTGGKFGVTRGTDLTVVGDKSFTTSAFRFVRSTVFRRVSDEGILSLLTAFLTSLSHTYLENIWRAKFSYV